MIFESLLITFRVLSGEKLRTGLTILGIMIGITGVITIRSVGSAGSQVMTSSLNQESGTFSIRRESWIEKNGKWQPNQSREFLTLDDVEAIKTSCPSVETAIPVDGQKRRIEVDGKNRDMSVEYTTDESTSFQDWFTDFGHYVTRTDMDMKTKICIIGHEVWQVMFSGLNPIGREIKIDKQRYTVVGVMDKKPQGMNKDDNSNRKVFIPITTGQTYFGVRRYSDWGELISNPGPKNQVRAIRIRATSVDVLDQAKMEVETLVRYRHNDEEGTFKMDSIDDTLKFVNKVLLVIQLIMLMVTIFPLVVGGIGIMNIMLVSVTERVPEIGLRKAVGAKGFDIRIQFLVESVIISLIGSLLGLAAGFTLASVAGEVFNQRWAEEWGTTWPSAITLGSMVSGVMMGMVVGVVFGYFPASQAARLTPIEAIRNK